MNTKGLINQVKEVFFGRLERKTGWGKEEVKRQFEQALSDVLMDRLDDGPDSELSYEPEDDIPF